MYLYVRIKIVLVDNLKSSFIAFNIVFLLSAHTSTVIHINNVKRKFPPFCPFDLTDEANSVKRSFSYALPHESCVYM